MAATVTQAVDFTVPGAVRKSVKVITADANYVLGGYQLTAAMFGFTTLLYALPLFFTGPVTNTADFALLPGVNKLQFLTNLGAEVAAATNLSTVSVVVEAYGA